ncbi:hypothetical protein [Cognatishimia sp. F0-27]|nr:hypothetical protein [Cognatishimia sp. F0-27]MCC1491369.1 hypothetical protein [Cognatishimia sp. F0-27]
MKLTLLAIALFFFAVVASFVWFVMTWDRDAEQPVSQLPTQQEWTA